MRAEGSDAAEREPGSDTAVKNRQARRWERTSLMGVLQSPSYLLKVMVYKRTKAFTSNISKPPRTQTPQPPSFHQSTALRSSPPYLLALLAPLLPH